MEEPVITEDYKGYRIKIYPDEYPDNPREWDNLTQFIFFHRRYKIGDEHNYSEPNDETLTELRKQRNVFSFPVYMYDHSGISFSLGRDYPYNCPWDSGQVGWIIVEDKELKQFKLLKDETPKDRAYRLAQQELNVYNDFVTGNVYGYEIEPLENFDPEIETSCWGFYGDPENEGGALHEAKGIIDYELANYKPKDV